MEAMGGFGSKEMEWKNKTCIKVRRHATGWEQKAAISIQTKFIKNYSKKYLGKGSEIITITSYMNKMGPKPERQFLNLNLS